MSEKKSYPRFFRSFVGGDRDHYRGSVLAESRGTGGEGGEDGHRDGALGEGAGDQRAAAAEFGSCRDYAGELPKLAVPEDGGRFWTVLSGAHQLHGKYGERGEVRVFGGDGGYSRAAERMPSKIGERRGLRAPDHALDDADGYAHVCESQ